MESFWSPLFQNAQKCQRGIGVFLCQDMAKSQKQKKMQLNGSQLAKLKKSIPGMSLSWNL